MPPSPPPPPGLDAGDTYTFITSLKGDFIQYTITHEDGSISFLTRNEVKGSNTTFKIIKKKSNGVVKASTSLNTITSSSITSSSITSSSTIQLKSLPTLSETTTSEIKQTKKLSQLNSNNLLNTNSFQPTLTTLDETERKLKNSNIDTINKSIFGFTFN